MTASDPRVGDIQARLARREAMIEDGSYKITRTRCNDPEREGFHHSHPQQVATETLHHDSYISHLEALADCVAYLLAQLRDRDAKLARVEAITFSMDKIADFQTEILGGADSMAISLRQHAINLRAAVAAATGDGES